MFWGVEYFDMLNILSMQGNNRYFEGWNIVLARFRFFRGEYSSHHDYPPSHNYHQYMIKKSLLHVYFPKLFLFWHYLIPKERATFFVLLSALHPSQTQTDEIGDMAEKMWISIAFMSEKALQSTLIGCLRKKNCLN